MGCKDIWEQTPAQRNYEFYSFLASVQKRDKDWQPLIDAKERREKELKGNK